MTRFLKIALAAGVVAFSSTGCVREARIALPSDVAATAERVELTGMGGWTGGRFRLAGYEGRFTRDARQAVLDDFERHDFGGGSFEVASPDFRGRLSGVCDFGQVELEMGSISVPAERFAYRCRFLRNGRSVAGGLILEELPSRPGHLLSGRTRGGEIQIGGRVLTIRAIHDMEGGRLPAGTPLGYSFDADGRQVGAVDLNGTDKTIFAPRTGPERELVLAASLALSVLWDPGE